MDEKILNKAIRNAIKIGDINEVKRLIGDNPESLHSMTPFGTWLHVAAAHGHLEIVEYLINAGIDINAQGGTFSTNALERATTKGHLEIAEYLISRNVGIDISEPDRNPLFAAIYGGHLEIVKLLVENNIDISIKYSGDTMKDMGAYEFAIERGQTEIAEYLKRKMDEKE
ncbi:ankyrin repeat domain-containing protein [Bacillus sp. LK2]|uniref:ankyrin repeat domain-containing protein n=1 Tax=Bacillus sp. LK2 TaxID=1628206 RepID=UPI00065324EC|nr:ankyrin repeat domain-containing protein [Bacillus sp. LK2]KMN45578.1 ankyrin [Bacillus sp. LK2]